MKTIALAFTAALLASTTGQAAGGRSCYGDSCRDKITETTRCNVTADRIEHLRALPSEQAQAVGLADPGEQVWVAARKPNWTFVQVPGNQNGGWINSALLTNCRSEN